MSRPIPYTSFSCRLGECKCCESGPHDPMCSVYCVTHCAHDCHKPKGETEPAKEKQLTAA